MSTSVLRLLLQPLRLLRRRQRATGSGRSRRGNLRQRSSESVSRLSLFPSPLLPSPQTISSIIWTESEGQDGQSPSCYSCCKSANR